MLVLDNPKDIAAFRKLALRSALGLEMKGFKRHGPSCFSIIKAEFGLKGNKQKVYDQFTALLKEQNILV
jgi:hypothetical protein